MKTTILTTLIINLIVSFFACSDKEQITDNKPDTLILTDDGITTIGIYSDEGAAKACVTAADSMFQWMGYKTKYIYADDINNGEILDIDLFYFPGGSTVPYINDISEQGRNNIQYMINAGCGFIGTCAGAIYACETQVWDNYNITKGQLGLVKGQAIGPNPEIFEYPEIGMCKININNLHETTNNLADTAWILFYNAPYFEPAENSDVEIIGNYDITGKAALVACKYGLGRVFITGPHPEWEEV